MSRTIESEVGGIETDAAKIQHAIAGFVAIAELAREDVDAVGAGRQLERIWHMATDYRYAVEHGQAPRKLTVDLHKSAKDGEPRRGDP